MRNRNEIAASEIIGFIFVVLIVFSTIAVVFFWYGPYREQVESESQTKNVYYQFVNLNDAINDLIRQGVNSSTFVKSAINSGSINLDEKGSRIIIFYSFDSKYNFTVSGLNDRLPNNDPYFKINMNRSCPSLRFNSVHLGTGSTATYTANVAKDVEQTINLNNIFQIGVVQINLTNVTSNKMFGRIWIFDTGSITYSLSSSSGTYSATAENGGVVISYPNSNGYLDEEPLIFSENNDFVLRIVQISPYNITGASGSGNYKINLRLNSSYKLNNSYLMENRNNVHNLKIQVYGDTYSAWLLYFKLEHGFCNVNSNTVYLPGPIKFTLVQSLCKVTLGV